MQLERGRAGREHLPDSKAVQEPRRLTAQPWEHLFYGGGRKKPGGGKGTVCRHPVTRAGLGLDPGPPALHAVLCALDNLPCAHPLT